ncbi:MAG: SpoIIE family protein phosphatase [Parvicellaceae bacterium]
MKKFLIILFVFSQQIMLSQESLDSLKKIYYLDSITDSLKLIVLSKITQQYFYSNNIDSFENYVNKQEQFGRKINDSSILAASLQNQGISLFAKSDFSKSLLKFKEARKIYSLIGNSNAQEIISQNIGLIYSSVGKDNKAISIYKDYLNSKPSNYSITNPQEVIRAYFRISSSFSQMKTWDSVSLYLHKALEINNKYDSTKQFEAGIYGFLASSFLEQNKSDSAIFYYQLLFKNNNSNNPMFNNLKTQYSIGLSQNYFDKKNYSKALLEIENISGYNTNPIFEAGIYDLKRKIYEKLGRYKSAYSYLDKLIDYKDSLKKMEANEEVVKFEFEIQQQLDSLKYLDDIKLEQQKTKAKEEELKAEKRFELGLEIGILVILIFLYFIYKQLKTTKIQKTLIEEKQTEITDSINYAKKIQDALMISTVGLKELIPESFIFFKPKDIVSGDFYWIHKNNDGKIFFTVADCTGHGVPGAFMSMIGNSLLNENIIENKIEDTGLILDNARTSIIKSLNQKDTTSESKDGMDMALCKYDSKSKTVEYSGANNPLIHISDETINKIKGDSQPIGIYSGKLKSFKKNIVKVKEGDMLYLFSDGFHDQFGGEKGKKYMSGKFYKFLLSISNENMEKQSKLIESEFERWKGNIEQIDDVCVMGVKVT